MNRKWTEEDSRWLRANHGRMDLQTLSQELKFPLAEVEKRLHQLKLDAAAAAQPKKSPGTYRDQLRELSAARKVYEKAIELFHKRDLDGAARRFEELITDYGDEKDLVDRAKVYLNACHNGKKTRAAAVGAPDEIFHAAVFEKNRGNVPKALELLKKMSGGRDGDGRVHYLAACCHALAGDPEQALSNLRKAIHADPQNRIQARMEADLASLRGVPGLSELLAG
jgi:tetratricopeptide (TPR) repeat protein